MRENFTKADTISNLYALRAGLSIASEITDKVKLEQETISTCDNNEKLCTDSLKESKELVETAKTNYLKGIEEQKEKIKELEKEIEDAKAICTTQYRNSKAPKRTALIGILILLLGIACIWIYFNSFLNKLELLIFISMIAILVGIGFIIAAFCGISAAIESKQSLFAISTNINKNMALLDMAKNELEEKIHGKPSFFNQVEEKKKEFDQTVADSLQKLNETRRTAESTILFERSNFNAVYRALQKQFVSFLDERDWGNVDLIIFYYETGRAVDLRDALLQVDMERRNERLIDALYFATREISRSIERGFGEMQAVVEGKFDRLNETILYTAREIRGHLADMAEENREMRSSMQRMIEVSSAQVALQNKINTSSNEMAEDIHYMRQLAHNTYYNR